MVDRKGTTMRHRTTRTLTVALLVAGMAIASTSAALARIVERDRWSFSDSFSDEVCGIEVEIDAEASGRFTIRAGRPGSPAFFASNVYEWREVVTNPENGEWLVLRGKGNFREVKATQLDGDVYRFRAQEAGQLFVIEDRDGRVVYRDRGLLVYEIVLDTLGDDVPGGEELSFEVVEMRGFPGYLDDICDLARDLLG
jgi:hypothetical protein